MELTIKCDNLKELHTVVEQLAVLLPEEGNPEKPAAETVAPAQVIEAGKKKRRQHVNPEIILTMKKNGLTARAIAGETGYGYSTVCRVIQEERKK